MDNRTTTSPWVALVADLPAKAVEIIERQAAEIDKHLATIARMTAASTLPAQAKQPAPAVESKSAVVGYDEIVDAAGRRAILSALDAAAGSRIGAIAALRIDERKLWRELERLGLWGAVDELHRRRGYPVNRGNTRRARNAGGEMSPAVREALETVLASKP